MSSQDLKKIEVDCAVRTQSLQPIWRSFGYDEINWTYTPRGKEIFQEIRSLACEPYYVRCHHTFTTGNGLSTPTRGSTNVCISVAGESPSPDFTILDQVLDTFIESNCRPIVELGFMPDALSCGPRPKPVYDYSGHDLWKYPPRDYSKWQWLIHEVVRHCVERYGQEEVSQWYWELWNEPDNPGFFAGSVKDYCKMYDFAVAGATSALPSIRIGGPALATDAKFLDHFLKHCTNGKNGASRERGCRLDFISFHAKGTDWPLKGQPFKMPSLAKIMGHLRDYRKVLDKYPQFSTVPCLLDEGDMAVATNFGMFDFPEYEINNSSYFPAFLVRMVKAVWDFAQRTRTPIRLLTTWAFYFEGKRFFEGNRALFTNENIPKPVFNAFSLLELAGSEGVSFQTENGHSANEQVDGFASLTEDGAVTVVLWNFTESEVRPDAAPQEISLELANLPQQSEKLSITDYRIDDHTSNSYAVWQSSGRPQNPTANEVAQIKRSSRLAEGTRSEITCSAGKATVELQLLPQSVCLLRIEKAA